MQYCLLLMALVGLLESCTARGGGEETPKRQDLNAPEPLSEQETTLRVELRKIGDRYQLFRNGEPYYIKGACGRGHLDLLQQAGGNSIRTYTTYGLDTLLDQAQARGITVMVGLWMGMIKEGFKYEDRNAVCLQRAEILEAVNCYKNHPAVLCWALGNEVVHSISKTRSIWNEVDTLALLIHQADPNHPVTTVGEPHYIEDIINFCPNISFVSINSAGNLSSIVEQARKLQIPYLIAELTSQGYWASYTTEWEAPFEPSLPSKYFTIKNNFQQYILPDSLNCLGSYVFYWGQKQEATSTWFNFFLEDGARTPLVDLMFEIWGGRPLPANAAPFLDSLIIDGIGAGTGRYLQSGQVLSASVRGSDPDLDSLFYRWEILPEGPIYEFDSEPGKGWREVRPKPVPGLIQNGDGNQIIFKAPPARGPYRIFAYAYDGHGNGAYANMPFMVMNNRLSQ